MSWAALVEGDPCVLVTKNAEYFQVRVKARVRVRVRVRVKSKSRVVSRFNI
jgi:hypothetical protein